MNFIVAIVIVNIIAAIEAKLKSDSTDVSSGNSQQELSMEDASSETAEYPDDVHPVKGKDHVHKHGRVPRAQIETRRWHKNCLRKSRRMCTKACERAYKTVCRKRKCSRRSKKILKRECRKSCTRNFEIDRDRAAYEE